MLDKTLKEHIKDIRKIVIRAIFFLIIIFAVILYYNEIIFTHLLLFLKKPAEMRLIFPSIDSAFSFKISFSFSIAIIILIPYFGFEILIFLQPAFTSIGKKYFIWLFISSLLYFIGQLIALIFLSPLIIEFFHSFSIKGIEFYINIENYIGFILKMITSFGFSFQLPLLLYALVYFNIISVESLRKRRKIVFVSSFIIGAALTPPDVPSQIILALALYSFFELILFLYRKKRYYFKSCKLHT